MNSKMTTTGIKLCIAALSALAWSASAEAGCSNSMLKGDYGSTCLGTVGNGAKNVALVGKFVFDGNGMGSADDTASVSGTVFQNRSITLTYNVDASCRGTATLTIVSPANVFTPTNFDIVLDDIGGVPGGRIAREIRAIETDSASLVTCTLTKVKQ